MGLIEDLKAKADYQASKYGCAVINGDTAGKYSAEAKVDAYLDAYNMAIAIHTETESMIKDIQSRHGISNDLRVEVIESCERFMELIGGGE